LNKFQDFRENGKYKGTAYLGFQIINVVKIVESRAEIG